MTSAASTTTLAGTSVFLPPTTPVPLPFTSDDDRSPLFTSAPVAVATHTSAMSTINSLHDAVSSTISSSSSQKPPRHPKGNFSSQSKASSGGGMSNVDLGNSSSASTKSVRFDLSLRRATPHISSPLSPINDRDNDIDTLLSNVEAEYAGLIDTDASYQRYESNGGGDDISVNAPSSSSHTHEPISGGGRRSRGRSSAATMDHTPIQTRQIQKEEEGKNILGILIATVSIVAMKILFTLLFPTYSITGTLVSTIIPLCIVDVKFKWENAEIML